MTGFGWQEQPERTGVGEWCAPGPAAEQKRRFILRFEDTDRSEAHYTDEQEARKAFARAESGGWNCHLLAHLPRASTPGAESVSEAQRWKAFARHCQLLVGKLKSKMSAEQVVEFIDEEMGASIDRFMSTDQSDLDPELVDWLKDWPPTTPASESVSAPVAAAEAPESTDWRTLMPAYGQVPWSDLEAAIGEAAGTAWTPDPTYHIGHQTAPINMNSLNRIVSAFLVRAAAPASAEARDAARYRWLRSHPEWLGWDHDYRPDEVDRELDAAIDAAIAQASGGVR